jgi:glucose-6-phosphate-specific signal transduction histidine kinase
MSLTNRNVIFMAMVMLCIILMTALTGIIISEEDDQLPDDDFLEAVSLAVAWFRIPVPQLSFILMLGMSIFALFVVYLGGRSNHKRFYDRTIEPVKLLTIAFLKTALLRAVFNFLFFDPYSDYKETILTNVILFPTMIPILRRY